MKTVLLLLTVYTFTCSSTAAGQQRAGDQSSESVVVSSCFRYMTNLHSAIADEDGKPFHRDLSSDLTSVMCLSDYGESLHVNDLSLRVEAM